MTPTPKHPSVDATITRLTGIDRRASISSDTCALCQSSATHFRDSLSRREFAISGLCQACQDLAFAPPTK